MRFFTSAIYYAAAISQAARFVFVPPAAAVRGARAASLAARYSIAAALFLFSTRCPAEDSLKDVGKVATEWVKLRVETKRLETAWQEEHALVESMVVASKERAVAAEEKRDLLKARTAKEREELDSLRAKNKAAAAELLVSETRLQAVAEKLTALRPKLPPRLSEALEFSYLSLSNPKLSPGERMQLTMTVLNRCAQFNRVVTTGEDVLTLEGEPTPKTFEVIYWGLSHGYAVDRAAHKVWLGAPDAGGWRWRLLPDAFENVVRLIAIANDKTDPDFVVVPAVVGQSLPEASKN
jgi:hypothetical protein